MRKELNLRLLSNVVIIYMLVAFTWWSVLLFIKNKDAYQAKVELLRIVHAAEGLSNDNSSFSLSKDFLELKKQYSRHQNMIFGEAAVFVISLVIGVWLVNRGYLNLMRASRQQRDFLLSITHELKSPLSAIKLAFETMNKHDLNEQQIREISKHGLKDTNRLQELVSHLLLAAKVEASFEPDYQDVDLRALLIQIADRHQLSEDKKIYISLDCPEELHLIQGDPEGLRSIFNNLVENGIKYSDKEARINISVKELSDDNIVVSISDQGIGISPALQSRVFDKFFRVQNEETSRKPGTGLGLFIAREMVKAHGGKISLAANEPKGSTFTVWLPKHPK